MGQGMWVWPRGAALACFVSVFLAGCASGGDDGAGMGANQTVQPPQESRAGSTRHRPALPVSHVRHARNVIILINDGAGWGAWDAAAYWQHGDQMGLPQSGFAQRYGMSTFVLEGQARAGGVEPGRSGYDPVRAWSELPAADPVLPFEGYRYLNEGAADSAAAGTALASGIKTRRQAINVDLHGQPVPFISSIAHMQGRATGVVTSVPFSHATPAAFGANHVSRQAYHDIADQMLGAGVLDLIVGTGAPGFNVNGTPCNRLLPDESTKGCENPHVYLSEATWQKLAAGELVPQGETRPWTVVRSKADFEALADGSRKIDGPLFGSPQVAGNGTLQQGREAAVVGRDAAMPSGVARIASVPSLRTLTEVALRHLSRDPDGFFLMVEGGATDWAAHTSSCRNGWNYGACTESRPELGRMIEETLEFNDAVAAVVDWVGRYSSWDETLVIVTSDHDNSMPMGPDADRIAFQPVENRGQGRMPGLSFRGTGSHSNALVPLWAHGAGAQRFVERIRGRDAGFARRVTLIGNDGSYVDNTDVFEVMKAALGGESTPGKDDGSASAKGR